MSAVSPMIDNVVSIRVHLGRAPRLSRERPRALVVRLTEILERKNTRLPRVSRAGPLLAGEGGVAIPARITTTLATVVTDLESSCVRTRLRSPGRTAAALPVVEGVGVFSRAEGS